MQTDDDTAAHCDLLRLQREVALLLSASVGRPMSKLKVAWCQDC